MAIPAISDLKVSKKQLSMYSRTRCDRMLYFTVHGDTLLKKYGLPVPLKARPGVGVLQEAGVDFETIKYELITDAFPNAVHSGNDWKSEDLSKLIRKAIGMPCFLIQGKFSPEIFRIQALTNLGLKATEISLIPPLSDMIPDILIFRDIQPSDEEILPNGSRKKIDSVDDRKVIVVIDVKHTREANASYSSEVVLYAYMLANYLQFHKLDRQFIVTSQAKLWTRSSEGASLLMDALKKKETNPDVLLDALTKDCDSVPFNFYIQTVRRFFKEDIPRVLQNGREDWTQLDWHVDAKCSSCDWLGYRQWLDQEDAQRIIDFPDHYCIPKAAKAQHLSRLIGLSRGARKTLTNEGYTTTADVADSTGRESVYKDHSLLRRERNLLPTRAKTLSTNSIVIDPVSQIATLAKDANLRISVTINFDSSAGLLTGLGTFARLAFPFRADGSRPDSIRLPDTAFVVEKKTSMDEWASLAAFLSQLADYIDRAEQEFTREGYPANINIQIAFWERRQFKELCAAIGRHLSNIFVLLERREKALAWLFPPDTLLARPDDIDSSVLVFIEDIVKHHVFIPATHALTLANTIAHYYYGDREYRKLDSFFAETLTNGIPRERIYEIWSGASTIKRGKTLVSRSNVIVGYDAAIKWKSGALDNIVLRLLTDFRRQLIATAPRVNTSIPQGTRSVAFDSKLWVWWDELEYSAQKHEDIIRMSERPDVLEANFEAVRLTTLVGVQSNGNRIYTVSPDSTEVKIDDGEGYLAIGLEQLAGFPLRKAARLGDSNLYTGYTPHTLWAPLHSVLNVKLIQFDRDNLQAEISITATDPDLLTYLDAIGIDFSVGIYLMKGVGRHKRYEITKRIVQQIRTPAIAYPAPGADATMGSAPSAKRGTDPLTPVAQVLWDAPSLQTNCVTVPTSTLSIAQEIVQAIDLNPSQSKAILQALKNRLTVIWGPPGTGKTNTLKALTHILVRNAVQQQKSLNILICGPTYKSVEEIIGRFVKDVEQDSLAACDLFVAYSQSAVLTEYSSNATQLKTLSYRLIANTPDWQTCRQSLTNSAKVTLVATTCHQAHKLNEYAGNIAVCPLFDFVILDESSQIPVTLSLGPLATLKDNFQLVVAGDHLQMPPISALEEPVGAEYLVGSIQTYLIKRFSSSLSVCELLENYRSADAIVRFAKQIGYPATLKSKWKETKLRLLKPVETLKSTFPTEMFWSDSWVTLLDPDKRALTLLHNDELSSQSNLFEARVVAALTYCLRNCVSSKLDGRREIEHEAPDVKTFWDTCVGIVTPHRAQRALIIRELAKLFPNEINEISSAVDTVEKFQGGQRHTILVSFGVADTDIIAGEEDFLMQLERTNVAISRTMAKCLIIMPTNLAAHVPEQKKALETAHALKGYIDEFCSESVSVTINDGVISRNGQLRWAIN